jgi:archaellum component FlaC
LFFKIKLKLLKWRQNEELSELKSIIRNNKKEIEVLEKQNLDFESKVSNLSSQFEIQKSKSLNELQIQRDYFSVCIYLMNFYL